jgi:hypothetical protein
MISYSTVFTQFFSLEFPFHETRGHTEATSLEYKHVVFRKP